MKRRLIGNVIVLAIFLATMVLSIISMAWAALSADTLTAAYTAYYNLLKTAVEDHVITGVEISVEQVALWPADHDFIGGQLDIEFR
ncbi:MAG: hypothetical protein FWG42_11620, partial [Clostridiales bacterium]|nr:hypothetical protein [Clostridiales bacterium]